MQRIILTAPADLTPDQLTPDQQQYMQSVSCQLILPMAGTTTYNGKRIIDAAAADTFDPAMLVTLGLPVAVVGLWHWQGDTSTELTTVQALDPEFINYLPDTIVTDSVTGEVINTAPSILHIPSNIAGWPEIIL